MNIPVNLFMWFVAFLPIIVLIILLIGLNRKAPEAAVIGMTITFITGLLFYKANVSTLLLEAIKGVWSSLTILLIIITAILLYQVGKAANAYLVIRDKISNILPNELLVILALGWVFPSFLQGITGFGVPVAVGAPLLIGIGVNPLYAVIIPLLGQSWGNTFGTLAASWDALALTSGLELGSPLYNSTAMWTAIFLLIWLFIIGIVICWFYGKMEGVKKGLFASLIITSIIGFGQIIFSQINTTLAAFIPATIALIAVILMGRLPMYKEKWSLPSSKIMRTSVEEVKDSNVVIEVSKDMSLLQAFAPYIVLSLVTMAILIIKPINDLFSSVKIGFGFPETVTGYGFINPATSNYSPITPFAHASFFLLVSALFGLIYYMRNGWIKKEDTNTIFKDSFKMAVNPSIAVVCLIIMSKIMGGTGQTQVLAMGIAQVLGNGYLLLGPFVGLLGTFMTGSNMSSNILFGEFQMTTAQLLGTNMAMLLASQTAGASVGSALSPSNIVFGTTTANIPGEEGVIMKKIIAITLPVVFVFGLILFIGNSIM